MSDRIDSIIDVNSVGKEIDFLKSNLTEIANTIKAYPTIKTKMEGAQSIREFSVANAKLQEELKAVESLVKQRFATDVKVITLQTDYAKAIAANRLEIQKQNRELKVQAELQNANTGSIERARAAVKALTDERNKLNLYTEEGRARQAKLNDEINKYNEFIRKNVDALAQQKINVGNYQGSAKLIVDAIEKEKNKLEELEKARIRVQNAGASFNPGSTAARTTVTGFASGSSNVGAINSIASNAKSADDAVAQLNAEIEKSRTIVEGFSRVTSQPKFLDIAGKVGDAQAELKFFTKALVDMERQGMGNSEAAIQLRKHLAELTNQIGGAKAEIKALSSDARGFNLFAGSVTFAADAMQTFAGAAVLAGASEDDVNESLKSLVAIQSVANGVKGIANELTTRGTAANKLLAFFQTQVAIATNASATAMTRFGAAIAATGVFALLVGLGLLIANFDKVKAALDTLSEAEKLNKKISEDLTEVRQKGVESAAEEYAKVKILYTATQDHTLSLKERKKAVDALQEQYPKYFKNLSDEAILAGNASEQYDKLTKSIIQMGYAEAAKEKIKEISKDMLSSIEKVNEANSRIDQIIKNGVAVKDKIVAATVGGNKINAAPIRISVDQKDKDAAISAIKTQYADAYKAVEDGNKRIEALAKNTGLDNILNSVLGTDDKNDGTDDKNDKNGRDLAAANAKAELEILVSNANERARIQKEIADNEDANIEDRLTAEYNYYKEKKNILDYNLAYELSQKDLTEKEKEAITTKYANDTKALDADRLKERTALLKSFDDKITQQLKDRNDAELNAALTAKEQQKATIEQQYTDEIALANQRYADGVTKLEDFEKEKKKAEDRYRVASLKAEIEYTKKVLALMQARGVDVSKELQDLAKLERELSEQTTKKVTDDNKKKKISFEQAYSDISNIVKSAVDASTTAQKNRLQEEADSIDKRKEKEIEAINASTLSEQDKANKIAIINARAQAQKEQIERRQREIDRQRAAFDKAQSIFNIILNTGRAVTAALTSVPPNVPLSIYSGAIGAAQLALAIATPLPKFKHGKGAYNDYEGFAWVDDGGKPEAIIRENGDIEIGTSDPRITYVGKNDIVHPDANAFLQQMQLQAIRSTAAMLGGAPITEKDYTKEMTDTLSHKLDKVEQAIRNKKEIHIKPGFNDMMNVTRFGNRWQQYYNDQINF